MAAGKSSRVNRKYKTKYRIRNWREYERGLRSRGDVTIWLSEEVIGTSPRRINEIVHGRRSITADTALRLGQALGMTPEFWLNLQNLYDLDLARASIDIGTIESLSVAP